MRTQDTTPDHLTNPGAANDFFTRRHMPPFEPDEKAFSVGNALWLMEFSRIIYRHEAPEANPHVPPRSSFLEGAGFRQVRFFEDEKTGTEAFLVRNKDFAVLAFRGTERNAKDVLIDLHIRDAFIKKVIIDIISEAGEEIHAGFKKAFDSLWKTQIVPELARLDCPVFYTGHSLGAALATLAHQARPAKATYTFGSPRVGKEDFAKSIQTDNLFRVVDDLDEVTVVPPAAFDYVHVGKVHKLVENPHPPISYEAWKHFADHAPVNYVDRM